MERFFLAGGALEVVVIQEMLLSRYQNMDYILSMEFDEGVEFLQQVQRKELERYAWDLYVSQYPYMDKNSFRTFSEFLKGFHTEANIGLPSSKKRLNQKSVDEMVSDLDKINLATKEVE